MQIRFHCPTDDCVAIIEYEPLEQSGPNMQCPRCNKAIAIHIDTAMSDRNMVEQCAVCQGRELFIRKDFPPRLGAAIVILFGLAAIWAFTFNVLVGWSILGAAVVLDLLIYLVIGKVTTCYACRVEYRKCQLNPAHEGFDLATSEKY